MLLRVLTCIIYAVLMVAPGLSEDMDNSSILLTTIPVRVDYDDEQETSDDTMSIGGQVLMVVYIGAAVILSVVPFGIYFYITCKNLGVGRFFKRLWNRCRKKPLSDDSEIANPWPYRRRPVEDYGENSAIYMIDLPTYDEVMKNADNFKITRDIKVFYSVYNRQSSQETQTTEIPQTATVSVQVDSEPHFERNVDNERHDGTNVGNEPHFERNVDNEPHYERGVDNEPQEEINLNNEPQDEMNVNNKPHYETALDNEPQDEIHLNNELRDEINVDNEPQNEINVDNELQNETTGDNESQNEINVVSKTSVQRVLAVDQSISL